ncbi:hypothetical protein GGX14DRAFT_405246 [Mycena pura]|uniref:Uncharacterized protein n=1 Tax=Mycena pura TaxID=153505 RepID=A0AAD6USS1_9AGAR|nr:hypothetical protein GGX14DRAFT_405246 [Mycena pura]
MSERSGRIPLEDWRAQEAGGERWKRVAGAAGSVRKAARCVRCGLAAGGAAGTRRGFLMCNARAGAQSVEDTGGGCKESTPAGRHAGPECGGRRAPVVHLLRDACASGGVRRKPAPATSIRTGRRQTARGRKIMGSVGRAHGQEAACSEGRQAVPLASLGEMRTRKHSIRNEEKQTRFRTTTHRLETPAKFPYWAEKTVTAAMMAVARHPTTS